MHGLKEKGFHWVEYLFLPEQNLFYINLIPLISVRFPHVEKKLDKRKWYPQDRKSVSIIGNEKLV